MKLMPEQIKKNLRKVVELYEKIDELTSEIDDMIEEYGIDLDKFNYNCEELIMVYNGAAEHQIEEFINTIEQSFLESISKTK